MTDQASIDHVNEWISTWVKAGYDDLLDLEEHLQDVLMGEGFDDEDETWYKKLATAYADHEKLEASWQGVTMNDRITAAFEALSEHGIIALENAGYTQSDGWADINEIQAETPGMKGGVFFHGQDIEGVIGGGDLNIRFGAFQDANAKSGEIAMIVGEVMKKHDVPATWSGKPTETIQVPHFEWRHRRHPLASTPKPSKPKKSGFFGLFKRR